MAYENIVALSIFAGVIAITYYLVFYCNIPMDDM